MSVRLLCASRLVRRMLLGSGRLLSAMGLSRSMRLLGGLVV